MVMLHCNIKGMVEKFFRVANFPAEGCRIRPRLV